MPFTLEQFHDVFRRYNEAVWPTQWLLFLLAAAAVVIAARDGRYAARAVFGILAVLWVWMAVVYHLLFFRAINPAAVIFAICFLAQGAAFAWCAARSGGRRLRVRADATGMVGAALALFALVVYPILGYALGHRYPAAATFGLPCPTTILTLALLLWMEPTPRRALFIVPLAWTVLGASAASSLGMREDFGLVAAGLATVALLVARAWQRVPSARIA